MPRTSFTDGLSQFGQHRGNSFNSFRLFVGRRPCLSAITLVQAIPHMHPDGFVPSRFWFSTQDAHARSAPSLGSVLPSVDEDGLSGHRCTTAVFDVDCGLAVDAAQRSMATTHPCAAAICTAWLRHISCVLRDRVGVDEVVLEQT